MAINALHTVQNEIICQAAFVKLINNNAQCIMPQFCTSAILGVQRVHVLCTNENKIMQLQNIDALYYT